MPRRASAIKSPCQPIRLVLLFGERHHREKDSRDQRQQRGHPHGVRAYGVDGVARVPQATDAEPNKQDSVLLRLLPPHGSGMAGMEIEGEQIHRKNPWLYFVCWNEQSALRQVIASKVTAVKVAGSWKIDAEQIQSKREEDKGIPTTHPQRFEFGGGGVVVLNPSDDFLPLDIPRRPGGCANGQCRIQ